MDRSDAPSSAPRRALVLEGGGMRGAYTAGVLEAFAERWPAAAAPPFFDLVVACSAGAMAAASYLAGQPERNRRIYLDHLSGDGFVRWRRLLRGGPVMDVDDLVDGVTLVRDPLDLDAVRRAPTRLLIGVTDADTGAVRYLDARRDDLVAALRATCALPLLYGRTVAYEGRRYVDGGIADPVPVAEAVARGARTIVVVLTSAVEARRRPSRWTRLLARIGGTTPAVAEALRRRHERYAEVARLLAAPPDGVRLVVLRPSASLPVRRTTRDRERLAAACDLGRRDGAALAAALDGAAG